jgi:hypothetical protein
MQPISWAVASGDAMALVIDSADVRYRSRTRAGATITAASTAKHPATFTAPVHG